MKKNWAIYSLGLAFLCTAQISVAQNSTTAKVQPVTKDGLFKMIVPSEIRSYSKNDLSDFRILDANNREVPYFLVADVPETRVEQFDNFDIVSKVVDNKKSTAIIIKNPKTQISGLELVVANYEGTKKYSISGSNDQKEWFGSTYISFPLCAYPFLKIVFDDSTTLPINVLKVGHANTNFLKGTLQEVKVKYSETMQILAEKKTLLKIVYDYPQYIDKLVFDIQNASLFKRNARIYTIKERTEKHKTVTYQEDIARFTLSSNQVNTFDITQVKQEILFVEIDNQDNPPLDILAIKCYQKPIFAVADLKANAQYSVTTGNPNLKLPLYDLAYFKETISNDLLETSITAIEHPLNDTVTDPKTSFWQHPWFMWLCISIGGLMILFFSMKLIKEM
jgi:hypothetical protein